MMQEAKVSKAFWPEAHKYANLLRNFSPTRALDKVTPHEAFWGHKPDVSPLRIFGSKCHVRVPPEHRKKLDAHSIDGVFCGFTRNSKAYRIWIPGRRKFVSSRDVIIYEKVDSTPLVDDDMPPAQSEGVQIPAHAPTVDSTPVEEPNPDTPTITPRHTQHLKPEETHPNPDELHQARVSRLTWKRREMEANIAYLANHLNSGDVPVSYHEAIGSPDAEHWHQAMQEEFDMLTEWKTWELVNLPPEHKTTGSQWTYDIKRGPNGKITRYKAHFITQGFSQIPGLDFDDTFSPTVQLDTLHILLHLAATYHWFCAQDNVKGAFLHLEMDHDVYL
jgi:hypothetical protein